MKPEKMYSVLNVMSSQVDLLMSDLSEMTWINEEERKRCVVELEKAYVHLDNVALKILGEYDLGNV